MFRTSVALSFAITTLFSLSIDAKAQVSLPTEAYKKTATQAWQSGWDVLSEPLDYGASSVTWSRPAGTSQLKINYVLRGAIPNRQYQVGITWFDRCLETFGQFQTNPEGCVTATRQGVTKLNESAELGVVTTDLYGNGSFSVTVKGISPGTYPVQFYVREGVGCNFQEQVACSVIFQSPGPFGTATTLRFP